jgi:sugar fermentation stimulation protein A
VPLEQLERAIHAGYRAVLVFVVLHTGIDRVFPSDHIDLAYGKALRLAKEAGVECFAYRVDIDLEHIVLKDRIQVVIPTALPNARA